MIQRGNIQTHQHVFDFRDQLQDNDSAEIDFLFIAHPDEYMVRRLQTSFSDRSMVITTIPQFTWDFGSDRFVDWESGSYRFKSIVLVGSSQGGTPEQQVQVFGSTPHPAANGGPSGLANGIRPSNHLLQRAQQAVSLVKQNENHFIDQLAALSQNSIVEKLALRNPFILEGLFYRAESGLFCRLDPSSGEFQPLLEEEVA